VNRYNSLEIQAMSRYKGRTSARTIEKDFPPTVETVVPPDGLGERLNDMYDFHTHHGREWPRYHSVVLCRSDHSVYLRK
jgi:hypothetical protein